MLWVACPMLKKINAVDSYWEQSMCYQELLWKSERHSQKGLPKEKGTIKLHLSRIFRGNGWAGLYWLLNSPGSHKLSQWSVHTLHASPSSWPNQRMTIDCSCRVHPTTWCSFLLIWLCSSLILTLTVCWLLVTCPVLLSSTSQVSQGLSALLSCLCSQIYMVGL